MPAQPLLSAALLTLAAALPAQAQSLPQLLEQAQTYDAPLQAAQASWQAAQARAAQARAGLLPQIGLQASTQRHHLRGNIDTLQLQRRYSHHSAALVASQPLYRPANRISHTQGQIGAQLAQAQLSAAQQDLIIRLAQAYFDALAAQDNLQFIRALKAATIQQWETAQRNFDVGNATITDSREAQARLDLVRAQEIAAENDLRIKQLALAQTVGQPDAQPQALNNPQHIPPPQPQDINAWVELALATHPGLEQTRHALDIARLEADKARSAHLPTLDLQASLSHTHYPQGNPNSPAGATHANTRMNNASIGLALNWPLYAGHAIQNRERETVALHEKARAEHEHAQRSIAHATRSAYLGLQSLLGQIHALQAAEQSSLTALQASQLGYQVGVRVTADVLNAQTQLYQTRRDLARARYDAHLAHLRLKQASGQLSAADLNGL